MPTARIAAGTDLPSPLTLFSASEDSRSTSPREQAERVWHETMAQPGMYVFVSDEGTRSWPPICSSPRRTSCAVRDLNSLQRVRWDSATP